MNSKKIFLIGMPGSGKSTLGKKWSIEKKMPFFDLDIEIEKKENKSINQLFTDHDESYFRKIEAEILRSITLENECFILSTGGGTACYHENMDWMNNNGITYYLKVSHEILIARIQKNIAKRPLFAKSQDLKLKIDQMYASRRLFYERANFIIEES